MQNNGISPENKKTENKPVETDSEKIVRRHLENEDDEITDEDIRSVRVSIDSDEPVTTGAEAAARFTKGNLEENDLKDEDIDAPDPKDKPVTPWDVLDEKL